MTDAQYEALKSLLEEQTELLRIMAVALCGELLEEPEDE